MIGVRGEGALCLGMNPDWRNATRRVWRLIYWRTIGAEFCMGIACVYLGHRKGGGLVSISCLVLSFYGICYTSWGRIVKDNATMTNFLLIHQILLHWLSNKIAKLITKIKDPPILVLFGLCIWYRTWILLCRILWAERSARREYHLWRKFFMLWKQWHLAESINKAKFPVWRNPKFPSISFPRNP